MFTTALATVAAFQMVLFRKNNKSLLGVVIITFFSGYIAVGLHVCKVMI